MKYLFSGQKTVKTAGVAEVLSDEDRLITNSILIQAKRGNTGYVYVGRPGEMHVELEAQDVIVVPGGGRTARLRTNMIFIDVSVGGEGVNFIGY